MIQKSFLTSSETKRDFAIFVANLKIPFCALGYVRLLWRGTSFVKGPIMGRYYDPVSEIEEGAVGRLIVGSDFDVAKNQLRPGERLYALCDRLVFKYAVCVDDREEFYHFYEQYQTGQMLSFELVALSEEEIEAARSR